MEIVKQQTKRWSSAVFAAIRYIAYNALLTYHAWHVSVKDTWGNVDSWDRLNVACSVSLAMLLALGAVMNDKWEKARDNKPK